jgi:hypothetical protein
VLAINQEGDAVVLLEPEEVPTDHASGQRQQPIVLIDLVAFDQVVELQQRARGDVLRHLKARRAHDVG